MDPKTHTPRLNKYLTYFVESEVYKDKTGICDYGKTLVTAVFTEQREFLARKALADVDVQMTRIMDDLELTLKGERIDIRSYNDRVIDVLNAMTYIACCARNLPRSLEAIAYRRNNIL